MIEDAAEKRVDEAHVDPVAQAAGENFLPVEHGVLAFFQEVVCDQKFRVALLRRHPAENLRHDQADVVVHTNLRSDISGGGHERAMAGEDERDERVVQINDRRQGVERAFGQRAFRSGAGRGR